MIFMRQRDIVLFVTSVGSYPVCIFGIIANVINIIVFTKNGFSESVNVCLAALAIFDLCGQLVILGTASLGVMAARRVDNLNFEPIAVLYLVACALNGCLYSTAGFISFFVNVERCLCFVLPLRIKTLITPLRSALTVFVVFTASVCSLIPAYLSVELGWRHNPALNRTLLGIVVRRADTDSMLYITYYVTAITHFLIFLALVVSIAALSVILKRQARWRQTMSQRDAKKESETRTSFECGSSRNIRVGRMIQLVSLLLLISYSPSIVLLVLAMSIPEIGQIYQDDARTVITWSIATFFLCTNSSINIFLYLRMNSRYRNTFKKIFGNFGNKLCGSKVGHSGQSSSISERTPQSRLNEAAEKANVQVKETVSTPSHRDFVKDKPIGEASEKGASTQTSAVPSKSDAKALDQSQLPSPNIDSKVNCRSSLLPASSESRPFALFQVLPSNSDTKTSIKSSVPPSGLDSKTPQQSPRSSSDPTIEASAQSSLSLFKKDIKTRIQSSMLPSISNNRKSMQPLMLPTFADSRNSIHSLVLPNISESRKSIESSMLPSNFNSRKTIQSPVLPSISHS